MARTYFLEYLASQKIAAEVGRLAGVANEFYSLLLAAARFADSDNLDKLQELWPDLVIDLRTRYNAPGGAINEGERNYLRASAENKEEGE